jgi:hypothetical protein
MSAKSQLSTSFRSGLVLENAKEDSISHFRTPGQNYPGFGYFPLVWVIPRQICQFSALYLI